MFFLYKGINENKKYKRGVVEADSSSEAVNKLKYEGIIAIVSLSEVENNSITRFRVKLNKNFETLENKINDKTIEFIKSNEIKKEAKRKKREQKKGSQSSNGTKKTLAEKSPILAGINKIANRTSANKARNEEYKDIYKEEIDKMFAVDEEEVVKQLIDSQKRENEKGTELDISILDAEMSPEVKKNMKIKVKEKELTMFTRRLHIMISSGMSLLTALLTLQETTSKELSGVLSKITDDIQSGTTFSEALSKFPRQFDSTYVSLVSIGEKSGGLDKSLKDIIRVRDQRAKIANKLKVASMYPIVIGIVLVALMAGAFLFFLPRFEEMYSEQDLEMPMFSQIVFGIAGIFPIIAVVLVALLIVYTLLRKNSNEVEFLHRRMVDKLILNFPAVKRVSNAAYMYTFSSTIALMLDNGIRLSDTLELTKRTINNVYIKNEIGNVSSLMVHGDSFSEALKTQKTFDDILINVVNTGEKSGKMVYSLEQVSAFYNDELTRQVDSLLELVQPVSIMLIAIVIAPIIVAAYLPILEISSGGLSGFN